jgi:hypothetical protein
MYQVCQNAYLPIFPTYTQLWQNAHQRKIMHVEENMKKKNFTAQIENMKR